MCLIPVLSLGMTLDDQALFFIQGMTSRMMTRLQLVTYNASFETDSSIHFAVL